MLNGTLMYEAARAGSISLVPLKCSPIMFCISGACACADSLGAGVSFSRNHCSIGRGRQCAPICPQACAELFSGAPTPGSSDIVETDASSGRKFSRHLVIRIPGYALLSNHEVRLVVNHMLSCPEAADLVVNTNDGQETFVVDRSVYSR